MLYAIPTGFSLNVLICFNKLALSSQEKNTVKAITTIAFLISSYFEYCNYRSGTFTLLLIQQSNLIVVPWFPSVNISVLEGALPS